ncbi:MAG: ISNCY family transposase [bacterium]
MAEDIIMATQRELNRLHVIKNILEGRLTQSKAAKKLSLSVRQVKRLVKKVKSTGDIAIVHFSRGKPSHRKLSNEVRLKVLNLYKEKYPDFGPTLFCEKLIEYHDIKLSDETLRKLLLQEGLWKRARKTLIRKQLRERKECFGEMLQLDGSHHDWFEGRRDKAVLMSFIDDATSKVYARFYEYEGTFPAMNLSKLYMKKYGIPMSIYSDKHTTYKSTDKNKKALSQFGRALEEIGIELMHANTPQAKGRIERLFGTLQDRLVKEMRLKNISDIETANNFLEEYLPVFNKKFNVIPLNDTDVNTKIDKTFNFDSYLCIKHERIVKNDNTVSYNSKLYQLEPLIRAKKITVEEHMDNSIHIKYNGSYVKYKEIIKRPVKVTEKIITIRKEYSPPLDHPWRKTFTKYFQSKHIERVDEK